VNTTQNRVWVENSPLLHTLLVPTPSGLSCGGSQVKVLENQSKGRRWQVIKGTYLDVLDFVTKNPNGVSAWSAPTNLQVVKKVFFAA
jgi:hypothetical protein